jgi:hypothetical protein
LTAFLYNIGLAIWLHGAAYWMNLVLMKYLVSKGVTRWYDNTYFPEHC